MRIEFLWWPGCPSTESARAALTAALVELGHPDTEVRMREIATDQAAEEAQFAGSPTILLDGVDPFATDGPVGLSCRIYRRRDGRVSATPDPDDLREALRRSFAAEVALA